MYAVNLGFEVAAASGFGSPMEGARSAESRRPTSPSTIEPIPTSWNIGSSTNPTDETIRKTTTTRRRRSLEEKNINGSNDGRGDDEKRRQLNGQAQFFKAEDQLPGSRREEGTSRFSSSTTSSRPPTNDEDDYGREDEEEEQQAPAAMKCQLFDSSIGGVGDCGGTSDANGGRIGHDEKDDGIGESESTTKDCSDDKRPTKKKLLLGDDDGGFFLNGGKGKRIITATAPPHLRSYYSQENIRGGYVVKKKEASFNDDNLFKLPSPLHRPSLPLPTPPCRRGNMEKNVGGNEHHDSPTRNNTRSTLIGLVDNVIPSTSSSFVGSMSSDDGRRPPDRFENGGNMEMKQQFHNPIFPGHRSTAAADGVRPPPPPYNIAVAGNSPSRGSTVSSGRPTNFAFGASSTTNGLDKQPIGRAPMFITAANRTLDHGDISTMGNRGGDDENRRIHRRIHGGRQILDSPVAGNYWTPRFDSSLPSQNPYEPSSAEPPPNSSMSRPAFGLFENQRNSTDRSADGQAAMQRGVSVENVRGLSAIQPPPIRYWPSTPCIANPTTIASSNSQSNSAFVGLSTTSSANMSSSNGASYFHPPPILHSSIQPSRAYLNPLPEIRENVAVVSLPATPTGCEPSPYLLPSIVSDRRSSWFSSPWSSVRTGLVSRLVKAVSCDATNAGGKDLIGGSGNLSPKDINYLSNLHRVTKLAECFENGDVDRVGPLKLYHAQVYKRELEKICAENYGSVLAKAQCFESGTSLPIVRSSLNQLPINDPNSPCQRASYSFSSVVSDDLWTRCAVGSRENGSEHSMRMFPGNDAAVKVQEISFNKTTFPIASEPNLPNVGSKDLPAFTVTDYNNERGVNVVRGAVTDEERRSRRTSYVMATTASPRNVVATTSTSGFGQRRSNREEAASVSSSYPVSEEEAGGSHHRRRLNGETEEDVGGEDAECVNRLQPSSVVNTSPNSIDEAFAKMTFSPTIATAAARFHRKGPSANQEAPRLSRLQIPEPMERKNSSGSSLSMTPTPTPSPTSGGKQARIQRFISFFSGDQASLTRYSDGCVAGPGSSTSLSSCYTGASTSSNQAVGGGVGGGLDRSSCSGGKRISTGLSSPPTIEGLLSHKQLVSQIGGGGKKRGGGGATTDRNWKDYWAVLHGFYLYLCRERPSVRYRSETAISEETSPCYGLPEDAVCIDVESCIADIAYDYVKRKHVFRVTTQRQTDHLFQAADSQTMIRWIESLQRCSSHENQPDGISSSMALIIKRYEAAQSQSVSPSVKQRRSTGVGGGIGGGGATGSKSPTVIVAPNGQHERYENDGAKLSTTIVSSPNRIHSTGVNSSSTEKMERADKGDHTPGKTRKWRRVRKSGSCPVPSPRANESSTNPDAMFGARLEECPTSGDDDFVPLIIQLCVKVVESQGLEAVGVYRIPGNTAAVNSLIATLDKGFENANFNDSRWRDVNVVSSLLKAYFRKLPDPLLTDRLYQHFIDASRMENHSQKLKRIRSLIEKLPRGNYETLKYMLFHLRRIVSHSGVNKMEARNLALMFGPSLVRPCGDSSMTTMVTHMSDQCKIVELLITYCDWLFLRDDSEAPTAPPPPTASADIANTSFADMTDLLRRVKTTENDLERTKENIVKSILNVRRGSRKLSKGKLTTPESSSSANVESSSSNTPKAPNFVSCTSVNGHHHHHDAYSGHEPLSREVAKAASASPYVFNERNIDEEIESRQQRTAATSQATPTHVSTSSKGVSTDPNVVDDHRNGSSRETNVPNDNYAKADVGVVFRSDNSQQGMEEMRRRREDHIYAARRIFIVGTEGNNILQSTPPVDTAAKMDLMAQHSRHLNVNPQSLDVLSPETREKIRRLQTDSQMLRSKGHWQTQQLKKVANERQRIEMAWERAKQDYEQDDFLDDLAENPGAGLALMTASSNPHLSVASTDALSTSSDYSTTSSLLAGYDGNDRRRHQQQHPLQKQQQKLMSISCTGALPTTTDSSDEPSPNSTSSPNQVQSSMSFGVSYSPASSINRSPPEQVHQQLHDSNNVQFQPPSFANVNQTAISSSPHRRQQQPVGSPQQLYDRSRLKHVAPEVLFHGKQQSPPSDEQQRSSIDGNGMCGRSKQSPPKHSTLQQQKSKPWYDEMADEEHDSTRSVGVRSSFASSSENNFREPKTTAVDQNANNLSAKHVSTPSTVSNHTVSTAAVTSPTSPTIDEKKTRILAPAERGASRISQKIKFRSKSSSAEKRKDNRRHTLTDMETLKNVLFGSGSSSRDQAREKTPIPTVSSPPSQTSSASKSLTAGTTASNGKQSRTGKLKAWLKESFRKSSPDLYDPEVEENIDENQETADEPNGTNSAV